MKGLEKISLLTPEKEVELAKRIKEGERQVKLFEIRTSRLKTQIYPSLSPKNGKKKPQNGNRQSLKIKGKEREERQKIENNVLAKLKEKTLLYKKALISTNRPSMKPKRPRMN